MVNFLGTHLVTLQALLWWSEERSTILCLKPTQMTRDLWGFDKHGKNTSTHWHWYKQLGGGMFLDKSFVDEDQRCKSTIQRVCLLHERFMHMCVWVWKSCVWPCELTDLHNFNVGESDCNPPTQLAVCFPCKDLLKHISSNSLMMAKNVLH